LRLPVKPVGYMTTVLCLYASVAVVTALIARAAQREWLFEVFVADFIVGAVAAWTAGVLFGAFGPVVAGIPVLGCFGLSIPMVSGFNAWAVSQEASDAIGCIEVSDEVSRVVELFDGFALEDKVDTVLPIERERLPEAA
jgi:hypothetical protein